MTITTHRYDKNDRKDMKNLESQGLLPWKMDYVFKKCNFGKKGSILTFDQGVKKVPKWHFLKKVGFGSFLAFFAFFVMFVSISLTISGFDFRLFQKSSFWQKSPKKAVFWGE